MMSRIHSFTIAWANLFVERGFLTILRRINMSRPCHRNFTWRGHYLLKQRRRLTVTSTTSSDLPPSRKKYANNVWLLDNKRNELRWRCECSYVQARTAVNWSV